MFNYTVFQKRIAIIIEADIGRVGKLNSYLMASCQE